jgi:uncharacterized Tic20 family protein
MNTDSISQDEKTMALLAHLGGIFFGFIPSLVIWLIKKDSSAFVAEQAKEALNFQITVMFGYIISFILIFIVIGIFLIWALAIANLVLCIIAGIKANSGEAYRYPFAIRLIK